MAWTYERVESLTKLWQDGLSANQIAKQLGDVTRNAVIGKVHRLGLSGRAQPSKPARPVFKAPRPPRAIASAVVPHAELDSSQHAPREMPASILLIDEAPGSATIHTLGAHMCKWPIGDPGSDGFTFCGRRQSDGPYCVEHARVAYQPKQTKSRSSATSLARSLRRYL